MHNAIPGTRAAAPNPAPESRPTDSRRRRFLLTLGAGGAGAAVAAAGSLPAIAAPEPSVVSSSDQDAAYRATSHVRDYYRTARI